MDLIAMNCKQANESIHLADVMNKLGYDVLKKEKGGNEYRYLSPFRTEAEPSFYINIKNNCWYDHGEGQGSYSVVDFAIRYLQSNGGSTDVSSALAWLENLGFQDESIENLFSEDRYDQHEKSNQNSDLEFIRAKPVEHPAIFQYLNGRGISSSVIKEHLIEIQYRNLKVGKLLFGFGISNRAGGYEIRSAKDNPSFKSCLIKKDISIISKDLDSTVLNVFEGLTDFLSFQMLIGKYKLQGDCLIMHSLSSFRKTIDFINGKEKYSRINLWLDNDPSGQKMTSRFVSELPLLVSDQSCRYATYKDLNAFLKAQKGNKGLFFNLS